jgi:hypothetical protein
VPAPVEPPLAVVSDWSLAMALNRVWAPGAITTRLPSAAFCMVVKVIRSVFTLFRSSARPSSLGMLSRPLSTVSALVAALAMLSRAVGSVRVPALFSLLIIWVRKMCWA